MWSPSIGAKVKIALSSRDGQVVGRWESIDGSVQWNVRYLDGHGVACSAWFAVQELLSA